jgi:hypothetical protein
MRTLFAITVLAIACGAPPKKESAIVPEGDTPMTCCCKTLPTTAEKEIVPSYQMENRMECSSRNGDCVDDVQCSASAGGSEMGGGDGAPAPPVLEPSTSDDGF